MPTCGEKHPDCDGMHKQSIGLNGTDWCRCDFYSSPQYAVRIACYCAEEQSSGRPDDANKHRRIAAVSSSLGAGGMHEGRTHGNRRRHTVDPVRHEDGSGGYCRHSQPRPRRSKALAWANPSTGSVGVIEEIGVDPESSCRAFVTTQRTLEGETRFKGLACPSGDSDWKLGPAR